MCIIQKDMICGLYLYNGFYCYLVACIMQKNCWDCMTTDLPNFDCRWCEDMQLCSDGLDRYRQEWLKKGCQGVVRLKMK